MKVIASEYYKPVAQVLRNRIDFRVMLSSLVSFTAMVGYFVFVDGSGVELAYM